MDRKFDSTIIIVDNLKYRAGSFIKISKKTENNIYILYYPDKEIRINYGILKYEYKIIFISLIYTYF